MQTTEMSYYCDDCDTTFQEDRYPDEDRLEVAVHDCGKLCQKTDSPYMKLVNADDHL